MKLKRLEIKNIASIEHANIDFEKEPLADSNVILITGDTGAGKSTILDAICLALYATTPRMTNSEMDGEWRESDADKMDITDTKQLMRKNTTEAFARLSFLGSDGNEYEAEWHVERKKKNLDRTWSLKNLTHPEDSPDAGNGVSNIKGTGKDKAMAEAIQVAVGLTFDQFCRTTMLAQGDFTRFLKSGNKEKAAILEKITNTEQYAQIGAMVFELTKKKKEEMDKVDPEKQEQQPMKEDVRKELEKTLRDNKGKLDTLEKELGTAQKKKNWLSTEETLLDNQSKANSSLLQAKQTMESDAYKLALQNVKDWDSTADARVWLSAVREATGTIDKAEQTILGLKSKYITVLNGQEFIREKINSIDEQIRKIDDEIKEEGGENLSLEELNGQKEEVLKLTGNIIAANAFVGAYFAKEKERSEKQAELEGKKKEIGKKSKELEDLVPKVESAKTKHEESVKEYERLNLAIDTLAEKLRANLQINHRCPICGQEIKSLDKVPHEDQLKRIVEDAKKKCDEAKKAFDGFNKQYNECDIWLKQNRPAYEKELMAFDEDTSLEKAQNDAKKALEKCDIEKLDEHTPEVLEQAKENAEKRKEEIGKKIERAKKLENLHSEIKDLRDNKIGVLDTLFDQMLSELPKWKSLTHQNAAELPNILAKAQTLTNEVTAALTNKKTAKERLKANQDDLDNYIKVNPEMTKERLEQLIKLKGVIEQQRQTVKNANDAFTAANSALKTIGEQIEDHEKVKPEIAENETIESLECILSELNEKQKNLNGEVGADNQRLKDDDKLIEKHAELKKEHAKKFAIYDRWKKLNDLIGDAKGDKFRLIAQSYILANLVNAANVHMRTLTDRYTLHTAPGQDLIILVEDAYEGGVKRPVSTISGGEGFLVSLALALALSEIGQSLKVETLFIDEGFGTLSGEPLQRAINTLESLRTSNNRQVCAISHRDEVKDKIAVQIQVNQAPHSSSSTVDILPHISE
ncbi:MAG: AAA family ATPase [Bacteroidales bacterium]|nr:AAA family ATPase [Bacteroidales bacterium]